MKRFLMCVQACLFLLIASASLGGEAPYPMSTAITGIKWEMGTYIKAGQGSGQWPMTWTSDGNLYAAWGDGWGWSESGQKHSLGVSRISGMPPDLEGEDLWGVGPGSGVAKPDALVSIGGKIYMFWVHGASKQDDDTWTALSEDSG